VPYLKVSSLLSHLGIWTKECPFLCIEPWHGYSDTLTSTGDLSKRKEGIEILEPNTRFETNFSIEYSNQHNND
jgi:galactose mutarotase-like enzyme